MSLFSPIDLANLKLISTFTRRIERRIHTRLVELIGDYPAVALLGPRQVCKTRLGY
jgi:predicted AAA+ superfamily ATPase